MARAKREPKRWPAWRFGPNGESQIFNGPEEVPYGWVSSPGQVFEPVPESPKLDKEDLTRQLEAKGIKINPIWGLAHMKKVLDQ